MHTLKILKLILWIFSANFYGFCSSVEFEPCLHSLKNEPCNMTCKVPDLNQVIEFFCGGTLQGSCSIFLCDPNMIQEGGNTMYLNISSLSYASQTCEWTCKYGGSSSAGYNVTVYSGISGTPNLTSQRDADGSVHLTATADCLYPSSPIVDVMYSLQSGGQYVSLGQKVDLQSSTVPGLCSDAIETRTTAISYASGDLAVLEGKTVFFRMKFSQYQSALPTFSNPVGPFSFKGLTTPSSTLSSDISTTVSEPQSTISSDMPTTVSEVPPPQVTTSSAGLSQEMIIIISSSLLAAGVLIFLIVLIVKLCRTKKQKNTCKNKENLFATKQGNFTKKDDLKSFIEPRNAKLSGKRVTKQESILLDKFEHTQFNNSQAPKDRMYDHYPQTTDYMYQNNSGNQHVLNHSHAERSIILYGNQYDRYPKSNSGPNNRMLYQSRYPEQPRQNEGMFQYYRADNLYRGQQMYHRPYVAQYDHHIKNKPENKRFEEKTYERNWDFLY